MMPRAPLSGVVVTELGGRIGVGVCGSLLAQLGATVIVPEWSDAHAGKHRHRAQMIAGKKSIGLRRGEASEQALLGRLVERVVARHVPVAGQKDVALEFAVPHDPVRAIGDVTLLEQAIGNVIGSNLFNILGVLGLSAMASPLPVQHGLIASDCWWMLGVTLLLLPLIFTGRRVNRWEGGLLLSAYCVYLALLLSGPAAAD